MDAAKKDFTPALAGELKRQLGASGDERFAYLALSNLSKLPIESAMIEVSKALRGMDVSDFAGELEKAGKSSYAERQSEIRIRALFEIGAKRAEGTEITPYEKLSLQAELNQRESVEEAIGYFNVRWSIDERIKNEYYQLLGKGKGWEAHQLVKNEQDVFYQKTRMDTFGSPQHVFAAAARADGSAIFQFTDDSGKVSLHRFASLMDFQDFTNNQQLGQDPSASFSSPSPLALITANVVSRLSGSPVIIEHTGAAAPSLPVSSAAATATKSSARTSSGASSRTTSPHAPRVPPN